MLMLNSKESQVFQLSVKIVPTFLQSSLKNGFLCALTPKEVFRNAPICGFNGRHVHCRTTKQQNNHFFKAKSYSALW